MDRYEGYKFGYTFSFVPYLFSVLKTNSKVDWFREQFSSFNGKYQPEFAEIRTSRGMGFTFNMIGADEMFNFDQISSDFKHTRNITMRNQNLTKLPKTFNYPLIFSRADQAELTLQFKLPTDGKWPCLIDSLLVHDPDFLPTFSSRYDFANFAYGMTIDVTVTPEIIRTEGLKHLKPFERECYFKGEKALKFFNKYSQRNCEIECFTNKTFEHCNCVDLIHPFQHSSDICLNISVLPNFCLNHFRYELNELENFSAEQNCSCLPLCNSISYNIKYYTKHESGGNETTINVRMNMDDIVLFRRYQQFTFSDVVSYVGGLLGLFAGISMLSIVEFFYFFTIRLGVNMWRMFSERNYGLDRSGN
ncbi:hypothetical protein ACKWTF_015224 [Chironomus riparius]